MPASNADQYFQSLKNESDLFGYLQALPQSREPVVETEWLDFKGCEHANDDAIKSYWGEALSGFGNTEGGVLIWGIDARKDKETGIDRVVNVSPHRDAAMLAQRLRELLFGACDPPIQGVEIIPIPGPDKKGFVICYIPEGQVKPHRSEVGKGKPFYLRAGDNFFIPSISILRAMFYPRAAAFLVPRMTITPDVLRNQIRFGISLVNRGTLTAEQILYRVVCPNIQFSTENFPQEDVHRLFDGSPIHVKTALHPMLEISVVCFRSMDLGTLKEKQLRFEVKTFHKDTEPLLWECILEGENLAKLQKVDFQRRAIAK